MHHHFNRRFGELRSRYAALLIWSLAHRPLAAGAFGVFFVASLALVLVVGQDFFPTVDAGQFRLHVRAPEGTRIEETEQLCSQVESEIRRQIPADEVSMILDNIGLPNAIGLAFSDSASIGNADGEILVSLKPDRHGPTAVYTRQLRAALQGSFRI
jgi:multidrug efflux pump subunit AcrB